MVRIKFRDSGEIWERDDHFSSNLIKSIIKEVRWYRHWYLENCSCDGFSWLEIWVDDDFRYIISVSEHWTAYTDLINDKRCEVRRASYGE